jgi:hypothetical protein
MRFNRLAEPALKVGTILSLIVAKKALCVKLSAIPFDNKSFILSSTSSILK